MRNFSIAMSVVLTVAAMPTSVFAQATPENPNKLGQEGVAYFNKNLAEQPGRDLVDVFIHPEVRSETAGHAIAIHEFRAEDSFGGPAAPTPPGRDGLDTPPPIDPANP